jgi:hypothetical protein
MIDAFFTLESSESTRQSSRMSLNFIRATLAHIIHDTAKQRVRHSPLHPHYDKASSTMSKSDQTPPNRSADEIIQEEALRMARATQKPGQTKEQTKLIAQGIAKGIEMYKKQQSAKARERDKARKRALKLKQTPAESGEQGGRDEVDWSGESTDSGTAIALLTGGGLFAVMAVLHLVRVFMNWSLVLGPWTVPAWTSLAAALLLAGLSSWFFYKASYPH